MHRLLQAHCKNGPDGMYREHFDFFRLKNIYFPYDYPINEHFYVKYECLWV